MTKATTNKFSAEIRARAVRMLLEQEHPSRWASTISVSGKIDLSRAECYLNRVEALRTRMACGQKPARHHVRRPIPNGVKNTSEQKIRHSLRARRDLTLKDEIVHAFNESFAVYGA